MCRSGWPAGGASFTWATFNSPFKVTWSFNRLVNIFRLPCKISSTLVGWLVGLNSNLTVMSRNWQMVKSSVEFHIKTKQNIITSPISLSQEYCRFSLYLSFSTNQNVFDTNSLLLLNATCHFLKMKQEKVNATLHLPHFSPVSLSLPSPCNIY